jgi:hypothetical protein
MEQGAQVRAKRRPAEISVQARLCAGTRYRNVGDLIPFRSALWTVKGLYLVATRTGHSELYYILGETPSPFERDVSPV